MNAVTKTNPGGEFGAQLIEMKGDDIKDALLTQHDKLLRPAIRAELYQGEIEPPYKPWRGLEDDDDGEDADDDTYVDQDEDERDAA